jgi:hypothetical protein
MCERGVQEVGSAHLTGLAKKHIGVNMTFLKAVDVAARFQLQD